MVTDFFGNVFRFTMDSFITVETLPKYGRLVTASTAAAAMAAVAEAEAGKTSSTDVVITNAIGFERHLGYCHAAGSTNVGELSRRCSDTFGVGPRLSTRVLGAVAARNRLQTTAGGGAKLWYLPKAGYLGPDDFSFSVTVGSVKSTEAWVVGLHTRR